METTSSAGVHISKGPSMSKYPILTLDLAGVIVNIQVQVRI